MDQKVVLSAGHGPSPILHGRTAAQVLPHDRERHADLVGSAQFTPF